jgi:hypothetical protein
MNVPDFLGLPAWLALCVAISAVSILVGYLLARKERGE